MNEWYEGAVEKLTAEKRAGRYDKHRAALKEMGLDNEGK